MKHSSLKEPGQVQSINGFSKSDIDLINKYCIKFGYKPDFKNNRIYDAAKCHSVCMVKDAGIIYALNTDGIKENISENNSLYVNFRKNFIALGNTKLFTDHLSNVFGLISLKHSEHAK